MRRDFLSISIPMLLLTLSIFPFILHTFTQVTGLRVLDLFEKSQEAPVVITLVHTIHAAFLVALVFWPKNTDMTKERNTKIFLYIAAVLTIWAVFVCWLIPGLMLNRVLYYHISNEYMTLGYHAVILGCSPVAYLIVRRTKPRGLERCIDARLGSVPWILYHRTALSRLAFGLWTLAVALSAIGLGLAYYLRPHSNWRLPLLGS